MLVKGPKMGRLDHPRPFGKPNHIDDVLARRPGPERPVDPKTHKPDIRTPDIGKPSKNRATLD